MDVIAGKAIGFYYDSLNRLTTAAYQAGLAGDETFNYDLLGNRDSVVDTRSDGGTCNYGANNAVNEYTTVCGTTVLYDDAGNLIQDKSGYKYAYDYENRLTQITRPDDTVVATFAYDALGRRIEKVDAIAGTTKRFYYDDQRIVFQTSVSGGSETDSRYFIFGNYIDEVLMMHNLAGANTGDFYYAHDHLYSSVALFDSTGGLVERYEYDVYGQMRRLNPDFTTFSGTEAGNPYYFTGRELDTLDAGSCKLYYYRARSYDPQTGRFLQRDLLGVNPTGGLQNPFFIRKQYDDGMDLYEYVKSNSLNRQDAYGLSCAFSSRNTGIYKEVQYVGGKPYYGLTSLCMWAYNVEVMPCKKCGYQLRKVGSCGSEAEWWYVESSIKDDAGNHPLQHELTHVSYWNSAWDGLVGQASSYEGKCYQDIGEATCYQQVVASLSNLYQAFGTMLNWGFDCDVYKDPYKADACIMAGVTEIIFESALRDVNFQIDRCKNHWY